MQMRLGELLVRHELISEKELSLALENQKTSNQQHQSKNLTQSSGSFSLATFNFPLVTALVLGW